MFTVSPSTEPPMHRRRFLTATIGASALAAHRLKGEMFAPSKPVVISTWNFGVRANVESLRVLREGGSVLDAVERGVMVIEADDSNGSVGLGGLPDRDGIVTLDACIMHGDGRAGSVCFVQGIKHPISVARMVMEQTPHVMLVGKGAEQFAREHGIKQHDNKLTTESWRAWTKWLAEKKYRPVINIENHDTIGLLALDQDATLAGACTTSGLAFKMHGRVGDSPIIGAGLFVDGDVGGATCTGLGEAVLRTLASHLAVERMRMGDTPQQACEVAIKRVVAKNPAWRELQVGILALHRDGSHGAYSIQPGFTYALNDDVRTAASFV